MVFADTGAEKPETYAYLDEWILPFLQEKGLLYTRVAAKETLIERCMRGHTIPDRRYRWSTRDYKIRPINKHLKPKAPVTVYLGIAFDEVHRMKPAWEPWLTREYPLIDRQINRKECEKIIQSQSWPVPPKSGCWFCPFQRIGEWRSLHQDHPDLFEMAVKVEKNGSKYPEFALVDGTLEKLRLRFKGEQQAAKEQKTLADYQDECEGYCFT